jgi:DNA-binding transcriptional LysR family regulator
MPDPRLLRYFVAVADAGSVSAAARSVHVAQPSLSRQLRSLEASIGVELFQRNGGPLKLTAAGRRFLPIARDLLHRHDIALATARFLEGQPELTLTVAATTTTIIDVIAPFIAETDLGGITLEAHEMPPETAYQEVTMGEADLAMTNEPPPTELASFLVGRYPVFAYVAKDHAWAKRDRVGLHELADAPLITSSASGTRRVLASLHGMGLSYRLAHDLTVPQIAQALAAAGKGIAILSDDPRFGLHPLMISGPAGIVTVAMYASWDPSHYAATIIERCATMLQRYCVEQWPPHPDHVDDQDGPILGLRRTPPEGHRTDLGMSWTVSHSP